MPTSLLAGTATEHLPVAFFPDLDADIQRNWVDLAAGRYMTFLEEITTLCAPSCPDGVSLREPVNYGGAAYPLGGGTEDGELSGATTEVPTYFYSLCAASELQPIRASQPPSPALTLTRAAGSRTEEFASRCFPTTSTFFGGSGDLCASPPCTDAALNASLGGGVRCAALTARPGEDTT